MGKGSRKKERRWEVGMMRDYDVRNKRKNK